LLDAVPKDILDVLQIPPKWGDSQNKDKVVAEWKRSASITAQSHERNSKEKADSGQIARDGDIPHYSTFPAAAAELGPDSHAWLINVFPDLEVCYKEAEKDSDLGVNAMKTLLREIEEAVRRAEEAARAEGREEPEDEAAKKRAGRGALMAMRVCGQTLK
jgi:hypothetical protein